jgi:mono/diheme cytochrome c family protein
VFTASAHHSITAGSIVTLDPTVAADGPQALARITPEVPFPEAESSDIPQYYCSPWPLSERHFLVAYSPLPLEWEPRANAAAALGLYLLDARGNRELIYRDPQIGADNPIPLAPRPAPPVIPSHLPPSVNDSASAAPGATGPVPGATGSASAVSGRTCCPRSGDALAAGPSAGEMLVMDVYQGLGAVPRGTIRQLRVVQIFPKTTYVADQPPIGLAREENARAILGTVPVEADGSARFLLPAHTPVLFQALDGEGRAYQTMRSLTYLQPGERTSCVGCHEGRALAPPGGTVMAARRGPSRIEPGELGGRPFSFVEVVQPVLDAHCVRCHGGQNTTPLLDLTGTPDRGFTRSYWSLCGDRDFWGAGTNATSAAEALVPRFGGRNQIQLTPPGGRYGSIGSRLMKMLRQGHQDVKLSAADLRRLAAWIDLNAIFYGAYSPEEQRAQLLGKTIPMPEIQ